MNLQSIHYTTHKLAILLSSFVHIRVFDKNFERLCVIRMFSNFERKFECSNLIRMFMYEIWKVQIQKNSGKSSDRQVPASLYFNKMGRIRPPKENKITNAERCKAYLTRHKEAYKAKDALRKRIARENMRSKPDENPLRLQQQTVAKKALRLRKKLIIQAGKVLFISWKQARKFWLDNAY